MNKTRGLLVLVISLVLAGQIILTHSQLPDGWKFVLLVASGILMLSAQTMLLFSFFRVGVTTCGELCYNPDNWYWKTMAGLFPNVFYGKVSLCKAFWLTVATIFVGIGLLVLVCSLASLFWDAYWKFGLLKMILVALGVVAFIGVIIGLIVGGEKVKDKYKIAVADKPRLRNAMETTGNVLGVLFLLGLVLFMAVVMPIILIIEKVKVTLLTAIIYYLVGVAGLALTIGGAWLLIWGIFWYLPKVMHGTVLEQFLSAKKKQFCPTLTACSSH